MQGVRFLSYAFWWSNALTVMTDSGSSDRLAEPNSQTHQTAEGGSPDARVGTAQALPQAPLPNPRAPAQRLAEDQFQDYLRHQSLDTYAAAMKEHFSQEHTASIWDYVEGIKALGPSPGDGLHTLFHDFVQRIGAIEARKEAGRRQEDLL